MVNPDGTNVTRLTDNSVNDRNLSWESVNRAPVAVADEAEVRRGASVDIPVLDNDTDLDDEVLTVADITSMPTEGTVSIGSNGIVTYQHDGSISGGTTPHADTFEYEVEDARHGSARATVTVWINPGFDDVPEASLFHSDIIWLAAQGITAGCTRA